MTCKSLSTQAFTDYPEYDGEEEAMQAGTQGDIPSIESRTKTCLGKMFLSRAAPSPGTDHQTESSIARAIGCLQHTAVRQDSQPSYTSTC